MLFRSFFVNLFIGQIVSYEIEQELFRNFVCFLSCENHLGSLLIKNYSWSYQACLWRPPTSDESQVGDLKGGRSTDDSKDGGSCLRSSNGILNGLDVPMTRAITRRMKDALHGLILDLYEEALKLGSKDKTKQFINVIWAKQTLDEDFKVHLKIGRAHV